MVIQQEIDGKVILQLIPNRSGNWRNLKWVLLGMGILMFGIALFWFFSGAWMILPFAGLEFILVVYFVRRVCSETYHQQILEIENDKITMEWGKAFPVRTWQFNKADTKIIAQRPHHSLSPHRLKLVDHTQSLPFGERLNKDDIDQLLKHLQSTLIPITFVGETKRHALEVLDTWATPEQKIIEKEPKNSK